MLSRALAALTLAVACHAYASEPAPPSASPIPIDVRVTVELDASALEPQLTGLDARLDALETRVAAMGSPETPEPVPHTPTPPVVPTTGHRAGGIGMNLAGPSYWSTNWVYRDLLLQARYRQNEWQAFKDVPPEWFPATGYTVVGDARFKPAGNGLSIDASPEARDAGVHVYFPGTESAPGLFHPVYLQRLAPFTTLRFMDWMNINNSGVTTWAQRTGKGEPIEHAIELCNDLKADAWFCMPHTADDGYVRRFAELVKAGLHPSAKVYVEWSNEVWNAEFKQHGWAKEAGGGDLHRGWAEHMARDFAIWREVFADQPQRVVRVLAGQASNDWHAAKLAERLGRGGFDALSCAGYVGPKNLPSDATVDTIFKHLRDRLGEAERDWREHRAIAEAYGVPLVAYEGGQHVTPRGDKNVAWYGAFVAAQRDPRMGELYRDLIARWRAVGGGLFVAYNDVGKISQHGAWGALEHQNQPIEQAPKYQALVKAAAGK